MRESFGCKLQIQVNQPLGMHLFDVFDIGNHNPDEDMFACSNERQNMVSTMIASEHGVHNDTLAFQCCCFYMKDVKLYSC